MGRGPDLFFFSNAPASRAYRLLSRHPHRNSPKRARFTAATGRFDAMMTSKGALFTLCVLPFTSSLSLLLSLSRRGHDHFSHMRPHFDPATIDYSRRPLLTPIRSLRRRYKAALVSEHAPHLCQISKTHPPSCAQSPLSPRSPPARSLAPRPSARLLPRDTPGRAPRARARARTRRRSKKWAPSTQRLSLHEGRTVAKVKEPLIFFRVPLVGRRLLWLVSPV